MKMMGDSTIQRELIRRKMTAVPITADPLRSVAFLISGSLCLRSTLSSAFSSSTVTHLSFRSCLVQKLEKEVNLKSGAGGLLLIFITVSKQ